MKKIEILGKKLTLVKGDIRYFDSACKILDSIKQDFKERNINIYQDGYPNYDIIKNDLENTNQTLLLIDENENVLAQITSTPDELRSIFEENEVQNILNFYKLPDIPYVGLSRLFVHKSLRKHGIATFLINEMEEKYKSEKFIFFVHIVNKNAMKLYDQLGFKNIGIYNFIFGEYYTFIK
jgi:GNAT superfamily N-acetyltransferase